MPDELNAHKQVAQEYIDIFERLAAAADRHPAAISYLKSLFLPDYVHSQKEKPGKTAILVKVAAEVMLAESMLDAEIRKSAKSK